MRYIWPQSSLNSIKQIPGERPDCRAVPLDVVYLTQCSESQLTAFQLYI